MLRSIIIPSLLVCAIAAPILFSSRNMGPDPRDPNAQPYSQQYSQPYNQNQFPGQLANHTNQPNQQGYSSGKTFLPSANTGSRRIPLRGLPVQSQNATVNSQPVVNPANRMVPFGLVSSGSAAGRIPDPVVNLPNNVAPPIQPPMVVPNGAQLNGIPLEGAPAQVLNGSQVSGQPQLVGSQQFVGPTVTELPPGAQGGVASPVSGAPVSFGNGLISSSNMQGMVPDTMSAQTMVFPGNEFGPDLNAQPLEFLPVTDFGEIFRFDITPNWVKSRWPRVSTSPNIKGLHGLRIALVTGTSSWDLQGSLTYFFDANHQLQRITFRGWTGDSAKMVKLLTQRMGFKAQQTHLAGFYLAEKKGRGWGSKPKTTGALLMKHPAVILRDNPSQQLGMVMEINNPNGPFILSDDMRSFIIGSNQHR